MLVSSLWASKEPQSPIAHRHCNSMQVICNLYETTSISIQTMRTECNVQNENPTNNKCMQRISNFFNNKIVFACMVFVICSQRREDLDRPHIPWVLNCWNHFLNYCSSIKYLTAICKLNHSRNSFKRLNTHFLVDGLDRCHSRRDYHQIIFILNFWTFWGNFIACTAACTTIACKPSKLGVKW